MVILTSHLAGWKEKIPRLPYEWIHFHRIFPLRLVYFSVQIHAEIYLLSTFQNIFVCGLPGKNFQKEYIAICFGIFDNKKGTVNLPIGRKDGSIIERCIRSDGDTAITHYEVTSEHSNYSVVKCLLETGRTHQIRVHMSAIGHYILGDTLYGEQDSKFERQLLHAYKIKFIHPIKNTPVEYIANIPDDIAKLI